MLTARALEEDKLNGFRLGVDDYITKPFSTEELLARIETLLKNKKRARKLAAQNRIADQKKGGGFY